MRVFNVIASVVLGVLFLIAVAETDPPMKSKRSRLSIYSFLVVDALVFFMNALL